MHVQLIVVGEASGTLAKAFSSLARDLEDRAARLRTIISALTYPAFLLLGSCCVSIFLLLFAFPKIVPLFRGLHTQLPFTTRTLLFLSQFLKKDWLFAAGIFFAFAIGTPVARRIKPVKAYIDSYSLRMPFFGKLARTVILASLFSTLSTLLSSGVRLDEAIRMTSEGTSNTACRAILTRVRAGILSGNRFSTVLAAEPLLFPLVALQLVSVGEMTGTLSESALSASLIFEEEVRDRIRVISSVAEPLIMIGMGLVIGFIALAIISPMYAITQSVTV